MDSVSFPSGGALQVALGTGRHRFIVCSCSVNPSQGGSPPDFVPDFDGIGRRFSIPRWDTDWVTTSPFLCVRSTRPPSCSNGLIMAAKVEQAARPVALGALPRRRERPTAGSAPAVSGTQAAPQKKAPRKKAPKTASPPATKSSGRAPHSKSASSSPPLGRPAGCSNYAGPKFSEPPAPGALPQPPVQWTSCGALQAAPSEVCLEIANQLKLLLKVNA